MGHRHAMYINIPFSTMMYIACLCPNLVSVHFYVICVLLSIISTEGVFILEMSRHFLHSPTASVCCCLPCSSSASTWTSLPLIPTLDPLLHSTTHLRTFMHHLFDFKKLHSWEGGGANYWTYGPAHLPQKNTHVYMNACIIH